MRDETGPAARLRLLFVGDAPEWLGAVRLAGGLFGAEITSVPTVGAAIRHLLGPGQVYSHVLAAAPLSAAEIETLAGMADEITHRATPLLSLGTQPPPGVDATHIRCPEPARLGEALRQAAPFPGSATGGAPLTSEAVRDGLNAGWLRLRYQPMVDARTLAPVAVEALARLHHPAHGILHPRDFVPQAIACGQERVFTGIMAARAMLELRGLPLKGLRFGINMPLPVFWFEHAVERALELASVSGIGAERIAIEVLETEETPALTRLEAALLRWREAGFAVYIDDAGPAMPHWRALAAMPFTGIKLDRCLAHQAQQSLAAEIAEVARERGLHIVAEGIETAAELERARAIGVDCVQGYYICRPLPGLALPVWLNQKR